MTVVPFVLAAGEPSHVPFYIAGAILAIWAVAVSAVGLARPEFPGNERGARMVMGVSFVLVAVTIAMAIVTSAFLRH